MNEIHTGGDIETDIGGISRYVSQIFDIFSCSSIVIFKISCEHYCGYGILIV